MSDNRAWRRMQAVLVVTARGPHEVMRGMTENLSRGGLFVATEKMLEPDTEVDLSIVFPETRGVVDVVAVVRWVRPPGGRMPPGMGLEFVELSDEADRVILAFLEASGR